MDKEYSWKSARCVRYHNHFEGENHPCYWCGIPPEDMCGPNTNWCKKCGGFICGNCGKCWCNVSRVELEALRALRNKYCCNWKNFRMGLQLEDSYLSELVPSFQKALDYCRNRLIQPMLGAELGKEVLWIFGKQQRLL